MTREEAINTVRNIYQTDKEKEALEILIPELAESEDERIRSRIIDGFKNFSRSASKWNNIPIEEVIAYLEKQKENTEKEYIFRPLAGTDITIAAEQAIRRADEGDRLVLAFNGAYIPVRKGIDANRIVNIYDAFIEKQKERGPLTKEEEYILHRIIEYLEDETCPSEWISLLHDIYCLPYENQKEQNKITIEQVYKEFINPEKLKGAKTNKYIRAQLLWELMHNGIITEVDYQYLTDDQRKPWTEEEYLKAYRKGFDVSEKLKQKERNEKSSIPELKTPDWVYGGWDNEYMINTVIGRYSLHAEVAKKRDDIHEYNLSKSMENWLRNVVKPLILEKQKEKKEYEAIPVEE